MTDALVRRTVRVDRGERDRSALTSALACAVLAGGNGVCVRLSNRELTALWGAGLRFCLAGVTLVVVVRLRRFPVPRGRALRGAVLYGLLNFAGAFALAYYGLVRIEAGLGGALLGLVPLATLLLAAAHGQEELRSDAMLGGLFALAGVAVISRASLDAAVPPASVLALLGSVACFAEAAVVVRRFPPVHPVTMNAVGMSVAGAVLVAGAIVTGESLVVPRQAATWIALAYLVPIGSILVFMLYLSVLERWPASRAVYIDVLIPPVTVVLSAFLLDEQVGPELVAGGLLILMGVYLGAIRPRARLSTRRRGV